MLAIFNSLGGGEVIAILVIALIVLGPEKLPEAIRKFGNIYGELRRMSQGFQSELRDAFDEPLRELRGTAQMMQDAVNDPVRAATTEVKEPARTAVSEVSSEAVAAEESPIEESQAPAQDDPAPGGEGSTAQEGPVAVGHDQPQVEERQAPVLDEGEASVADDRSPVEEDDAPVEEERAG